MGAGRAAGPLKNILHIEKIPERIILLLFVFKVQIITFCFSSF